MEPKRLASGFVQESDIQMPTTLSRSGRRKAGTGDFGNLCIGPKFAIHGVSRAPESFQVAGIAGE
jgi:hypothetical protein